MSDETNAEAVEPVVDAVEPVADDQGNSEPVVPTDTPAGDAGDATDAETPEQAVERLTAALADKDALLAERDAEIEALTARSAPTKRAQRANSRSARVARYEESAFQGAVAGWERDTGQHYEDFADPEPEPSAEPSAEPEVTA